MENVIPHNQESTQRARAIMPALEPKKEPVSTHDSPEVEASAAAKAFGNFAYDNCSFFSRNPIGYSSYHLIRSAVGCIPYGLGAAAVFCGKNALLRDLKTRGLEEGVASKILNSPLLTGAQVATSFTFYRTGSFAMRRMHDRIFDEDNKREDTIREASAATHNFVNDFSDNLKVQANSTPWAALSLGYIASFGVDTKKDTGVLEAAQKNPTKIVTHKNARKTLIGQMGRNTIGYSVFFEAADALGKHYRLQKGIPDPTLHLSVHKTEHGETMFKAEDPDRKYGAFTDDAGPFRLLFKRLPPVAVGIGAYTAAKRLGYRATISNKQAETFYKSGEDGGAKAFGLDKEGSFLSTAWREGAATTLFGLYTLAKDPWEHAYDKFFEKLEVQAKVNEEVQKDHPQNEVQKEDSVIDGTIKEAPIMHSIA